MNRNVTIVVILLIFAVIAAYLVWLRGQYTEQMSAQTQPIVPTQQIQQPSPTVEATVAASPSTPATASAKPATPSATKK